MENTDNALQQAKAQMESIVNMVAALECDYDRLEELRNEKKLCTARWNMAGYMPEMGPENFDTWEEAAEFIADQLESQADQLESNPPFDETQTGNSEMAENLRKQAEYARSATGEISFYVADGYVYCITTAHQFGLDDSDYAELLELEEAAGDCESQEEAQQRIQEDPLSIEVRSSWQTVGETLEASEFMILLCTGGPAVRIVGELDQYKQPCRAWIEYQDWFTPWSEMVDDVSHDSLLTYCQQFYFGE